MFLRQTIQYHSNPVCVPTADAKESEVEWFYEDLQNLLELTPKESLFFFIIGDWNAKVGSQEILRIIDMFGLVVNQIKYILHS